MDTNSDNVPGDDNFIAHYVNSVIEKESITAKKIVEMEQQTNDQADSLLWQKLHKYKITSSNFVNVKKIQKDLFSIYYIQILCL